MRGYLTLVATIIGLFLTSCGGNETVRLEPPAPSPAPTTTSEAPSPTASDD